MNAKHDPEKITRETPSGKADDWTGGREGKKAVWQVPFGVGLVLILLVVAFIVLRETELLSWISLYSSNPTMMD